MKGWIKIVFLKRKIKGWIKTVLQRENGLGESLGQHVALDNVRTRQATYTSVRNMPAQSSKRKLRAAAPKRCRVTWLE